MSEELEAGQVAQEGAEPLETHRKAGGTPRQQIRKTKVVRARSTRRIKCHSSDAQRCALLHGG